MKRITEEREVRRHILAEDCVPDPDRLVRAIASEGALLQGHFALQGGDHSEWFLRFNRLGWNDVALDSIAETLLSLDSMKMTREDAILCPESAGFFLGNALAQRTGASLAIAKIDLWRRPTRELRTGRLAQGQRVFVVNDIVTTGHSLDPLFERIRDDGATPVGVAVFAAHRVPDVRRNYRTKDLAFSCLASLQWTTHRGGTPTCPQCRAGEPLLPAAEFN